MRGNALASRLQYPGLEAEARDPTREVDMLPPWIIDRIESERRRREQARDQRTRLEIEPNPRVEPPPPPPPPRSAVVIEA
jgi:hypothetical protein